MELRTTPVWFINKARLQILCLSLLIYLLLEVSFTKIILTEFHYLRFDLQYSIFKAVVSYAVAISFSALLVFIRVSDLIYAILCFILILLIYPATIMYRYAAADPLIIISHGFFFLSVWAFSNLSIRFSGPVLKEDTQLLILLTVTTVAIIPFVIAFASHLNWKNLLLQEIYESRKLANEITNSYMQYAYSGLSSIMVPLMLVLSLRKKKYFITIVSMAMLTFLFLCGAHKSVFFGTVLILVYYKWNYFSKIKVTLYGLIIFFSVALLVFLINHDLFLSGLITHRVFFIPAILDINYFDYFRGTPLYWSSSIFKHVLVYPFQELPQVIMGKKVFGSSDVSANNGIVSDGFMNFGIAGIVINVFITSLIFAFLNNLKIHPRFFGIFFLFLFNLISSYLPVVLFTHGGILLLILSQFYLKNTATINPSE